MFEPGVLFLVGPSPTGVVCADIDGLGLPDLVACNAGANTVTVLWNASTRVSVFCAGDGSIGACPCGNSGSAGHGCENSIASGGATLSADGFPSVGHDTLVLTATGELAGVPSMLLEATATTTAHPFGDGLACLAGSRRMLYVHVAANGVFHAPDNGDDPISDRSAALGLPVSAGLTRYFQVCYRDPAPGFCPVPGGSTWNASSGLAVIWGY
jgi:hypothetical protein